jgi:hypothetical protein
MARMPRKKKGGAPHSLKPVSPGCSLPAVLELPSDSIPLDYAEARANVRACGPQAPSPQGRASDKTCPNGHLLSRGVTPPSIS